MKSAIKIIGITAFVALIVCTTVSCPDLTGDTTDITYELVQIGGTADINDTVGIEFTFSGSVDSLGITVDNITVTGAAEKGLATFTKADTDGKVWVLAPVTVKTQGTATVKITKTGIEATERGVPVYKDATTTVDDITYELDQVGGESGVTDTDGIKFTFSASIDDLNVNADDITIGDVADKASSATFVQDDVNELVWLLSPVTVTEAGLATVEITVEGIEARQRTVQVFKKGQTGPEYCTIHWHMDDGTKGSGTYLDDILKDSILNPPDPNPTKSGYNFGGWYSDAELQNPYTFDKPVTQNLDLYAKWNPITYTVAYDNNNAGATGSMEPATHVYGVSKALTANAFDLTGHEFAGWTSVDGNAVYTDGAEVLNLTAVQGATVTLYAKWNPITYTVTFNSNGGDTAAFPGTKDVVYPATTVGTLPAAPAKTGVYVFHGWNTESDGSGTTFFADTPVTEDIEVYARWFEMPGTFLARENFESFAAEKAFTNGENYGNAGTVSMFSTVLGTGASVTVVEDAESGGKVLKLVGAAGDGADYNATFYYNENIAGNSTARSVIGDATTRKKVYISFRAKQDVTIDRPGNNYVGANVPYLRSKTGNLVCVSNSLGYNTGTKAGTFNYSNDAATPSIPVAVKTWHTLGLIIDFQTQKSAFFINGIKITDDAVFRNNSTGNNAASQIDLGDVRFYANWGGTFYIDDIMITTDGTVPEYRSVTWYLDGGTKGDGQYPDYVAVNTLLNEPNPPSKIGNTFGGWYSDSGLQDPYDFNEPVTADLNLYATWNPITSETIFAWDNVTDPVPAPFAAFAPAAFPGIFLRARPSSGSLAMTVTEDRAFRLGAAGNPSNLTILLVGGDNTNSTYNAGGGVPQPGQFNLSEGTFRLTIDYKDAVTSVTSGTLRSLLIVAINNSTTSSAATGSVLGANVSYIGNYNINQLHTGLSSKEGFSDQAIPEPDGPDGSKSGRLILTFTPSILFKNSSDDGKDSLGTAFIAFHTQHDNIATGTGTYNTITGIKLEKLPE